LFRFGGGEERNECAAFAERRTTVGTQHQERAAEVDCAAPMAGEAHSFRGPASLSPLRGLSVRSLPTCLRTIERITARSGK